MVFSGSIGDERLKAINSELRKLKRDRAIPFLEERTGRRRQKFTLEEAKKIRLLYDSGLYSYRELAQKFGCGKSTIANIIRGEFSYFPLGRRKPQKHKSPISERELDRIFRLNWEGLEPSAIAQQLNRSPTIVKRIIRDNDW